MMLQAVFRSSLICFLFSIGVCIPHRKGSGQHGPSADSSVSFGTGYASDPGFGSGFVTSSGTYIRGGSYPRYAAEYFPARKSLTGSRSGYIRGGRGGDFGFGSGSSTSGDSGSPGSSMDAGLAQMIAELMSMGPNRPSVQSPWNADQVPLGMIQKPPVYPSSHIIYTGSGYQRAQDSRTDGKYTTDTFNNIPAPGVSQDQPGTGSQTPQKTHY